MVGPPREPPPTRWDLTTAGMAPGEDLAAIGGDLAPGTLVQAYRSGLFPMGIGTDGSEPIGWFSPDPRGVLLPGALHVSRSLRRSLSRFTIRTDTAFDGVLDGCADPARPGRWITPAIRAAYLELHHWGWAHSVEVWHQGRLVGGLYGIALGGLFAAESMFHTQTDASKAAVVGLVALMTGSGRPWVIDTQWCTPHLASLGVREVRRDTYLAYLPGLIGSAADPFSAGSRQLPGHSLVDLVDIGPP